MPWHVRRHGMGKNMRRGYDGAFKATVALKSIQGKRHWSSVAVNEEFMPIKLVYGVNSSLKNCRACFPIDIWSEIRNTMSWYQTCIVRSASAISLRLITVEVDWLKKNLSHAPGICLSRGHYGLLQPPCSDVGDLTITLLGTPFCLSALEQALELSTTEICRESLEVHQIWRCYFLLYQKVSEVRNGVAPYVL